MLRATSSQDGVAIGLPDQADASTTLAVVDVDPDGRPQYQFYLDGTSSAALEYPLLCCSGRRSPPCTRAPWRW